MLVSMSHSLFSQGKEYEVKAHFLGRFTYLISWPESQKENFVIGIYEKDVFDGLLNTLYQGGELQGKPVSVRLIHELSEIPECDLLFIPFTSPQKLADILAVTANRSILKVSDIPGFGDQGVLINFYLDAHKIRFEINYSAIQTTGLTFDYKLLNLARIIRTGNR